MCLSTCSLHYVFLHTSWILLYIQVVCNCCLQFSWIIFSIVNVTTFFYSYFILKLCPLFFIHLLYCCCVCYSWFFFYIDVMSTFLISLLFWRIPILISSFILILCLLFLINLLYLCLLCFIYLLYWYCVQFSWIIFWYWCYVCYSWFIFYTDVVSTILDFLLYWSYVHFCLVHLFFTNCMSTILGSSFIMILCQLFLLNLLY